MKILAAFLFGFWIRDWFVWIGYPGSRKIACAWAVVRDAVRGHFPSEFSSGWARAWYVVKALLCMSLIPHGGRSVDHGSQIVGCVYERKRDTPDGPGMEWVGVFVGRGVFRGWAWDCLWDCSP